MLWHRLSHFEMISRSVFFGKSKAGSVCEVLDVSHLKRTQVKVQMALDYGQTISLKPIGDTEKAKMLRGERYIHNESTLEDERERCVLALIRFNKVSNPIHGVHPKERTRLLKEVVQAPEGSSGAVRLLKEEQTVRWRLSSLRIM